MVDGGRSNVTDPGGGVATSFEGGPRFAFACVGLTTADLGDGSTLGSMHHLELDKGLDDLAATGSMVFAVELSEGLYVMAFGADGIWVMDASDSRAPVIVKTVRLLGLASNVAPNGTDVFVASGFSVLELLQVGCAN